MEEESNLQVHIRTNFLAQHGWHKEKMKVMDPDDVSVFDIFGNGFSKNPVGFLVCRPGLLTEVHLAGVIVEDRPQN